MVSGRHDAKETTTCGRIRSRVLSVLARETSSGNLVPEIDGLRFLAILAVVLFHIWVNFLHYASGVEVAPAWFAIPGRVLGNGHYGVQLFFVISGFVLGLPFARQYLQNGRRMTMRAYFKRRILRLEPPYLINLIILFILLAFILGRLDPGRAFGNLLASMGYVHNVVYGDGSRINYVAWSLEIEVQFYILTPLLARLFLISNTLVRRAMFGGVIMCAAAVSTFLLDARMPWKLTILNNLQYFLAGFLLVDLFLKSWGEVPSRSLLIDAGALLAVCAYGVAPAGHANILQLFLPVLMFVIVYSAFRGKICQHIFANAWIYTIGGMCYTIYLYHFFVVGFLGHGYMLCSSIFVVDLLLQTTLILAAILVSSSVLFILFEKPFMRRDWHLAASRRVADAIRVWHRRGT